jgi:hypothetical protein
LNAYKTDLTTTPLFSCFQFHPEETAQLETKKKKPVFRIVQNVQTWKIVHLLIHSPGYFQFSKAGEARLEFDIDLSDLPYHFPPLGSSNYF